MRKSAAAASAAIHTLVFLMLLLLSVAPVHNPAPRPETAKPVTKLYAPQRDRSGGGGESSPLPPKLGKAPPAAATRIFIPPMVNRVEQPKLPVVVALLDAPPAVATSDWGSPSGVEGMKTAGPGGPRGIGQEGDRGVGDGDGPGPGGSIRLRLPRNASPPVPVYTPEPDYAEEARKARFQGTVILAIEVGTDGAARKIRVVEGLGMGLDEKAVEAVARWRFRPAEASGKPVPAPALVEVTFRLL